MFTDMLNKFRTTIEFKLLLLLLTVWSFFEASIWFFAPDFILFPTVFLKPQAWKKVLLVAILSSMLGGLFFWQIVSIFPVESYNVLLHVPFIHGELFDSVASVYGEQGVSAVLSQSYSFIPFKVWTYTAVQLELNPLLYFLCAAFSRGLRMLLVSLLGNYVGSLVLASRAQPSA